LHKPGKERKELKMKERTVFAIRGITAIFWLGFFMAISFMEAPLKFSAPGLSIRMGVEIGQIIFQTLNKCEWVLLVILIATCFSKAVCGKGIYRIVFIGIIMLLETIWILPILNGSAVRFINGGAEGPQIYHVLFFIMEILKVPVLLIIGWKSFTGAEAVTTLNNEDISAFTH
jgi:hypothetical protein